MQSTTAEDWHGRGRRVVGANSWQHLLCATLPAQAAYTSTLLLTLQRTLANGPRVPHSFSSCHRRCLRDDPRSQRAWTSSAPICKEHCRQLEPQRRQLQQWKLPTFLTDVPQTAKLAPSVLLGNHGRQNEQREPIDIHFRFPMKCINYNLIIKYLKYYI